MSPTRRQLLGAIAGTAAATKLAALPVFAAADEFISTPLPEFASADDFMKHEKFIHGLAEYVREQIRSNVEMTHQQTAFSCVSNYLLDSAINIGSPYGDLYGDTGEPRQSIIDRVLTMFTALTNGRRDMLDISLPPKEYTEYTYALYDAQQVYDAKGMDAVGVLGDAAMNLATSSSYNGARIAAHLTLGLMNACAGNFGSERRHPMEIERYRHWGSDTAQDERLGL